jgi:hypothetical protein
MADEHRDAMRRRARRIRQSVTGMAVALFLCAFLVVYVQLASGHDPALTANALRRSAASAIKQRSATPSGAGASKEHSAAQSTSETTGDQETSTSSSGSASSEESSASAVTTSQS